MQCIIVHCYIITIFLFYISIYSYIYLLFLPLLSLSLQIILSLFLDLFIYLTLSFLLSLSLSLSSPLSLPLTRFIEVQQVEFRREIPSLLTSLNLFVSLDAHLYSCLSNSVSEAQLSRYNLPAPFEGGLLTNLDFICLGRGRWCRSASARQLRRAKRMTL